LLTNVSAIDKKEKLAVQKILTPTNGVWVPTLIFLCIGFLLLRQAKADTRLFESDPYRMLVENIRQLWGRLNFLPTRIKK